MCAILIAAAGATLQASIGFGFALVAAPLLVLVDRQFVPGPLLLVAVVLTLSMAIREREAIDLHGLKAAIGGRLISAPPAAFLIAHLSGAASDVLFGLLVLAAVAISLVRREVRATPRTVFFASMASGFMGTTTAIGGPPMALVYQNARGAQLRATLAGLFLMGVLISLCALAWVGRLGSPEFVRAALLLPGVVIGLAISGPLAGALDRGTTRPYVLGLSSFAACVVLLRGFW